MVHSQSSSISKIRFQDFSLNITCTGNRDQPGVSAKLVQVCVYYRSESDCSNDEECISKNDSGDDSCDLFQTFVELIGREICLNKKPTIFNFLNETKPFFENRRTSSDMIEPEPDPDQSELTIPTDTDGKGVFSSQEKTPDQRALERSKESEDDDMRATIDRLRVGVVVGTILGFVFGVLVTGLLILLYTKKVHRLRNSRSSPQIDTHRKTQENLEKTDDKYDNANYTYCDVNDEICQRPTESSSKSQNSEESHKYQDFNLNTYNHLNENDSRIAITNQQYDHIREASAESVPSDGEYRMLEPANSKQEVGILPIEKPASDMSKPSDNNYFELENVKCQATNPDAYFVLEKDSK